MEPGGGCPDDWGEALGVTASAVKTTVEAVTTNLTAPSHRDDTLGEVT